MPQLPQVLDVSQRLQRQQRTPRRPPIPFAFLNGSQDSFQEALSQSLPSSASVSSASSSEPSSPSKAIQPRNKSSRTRERAPIPAFDQENSTDMPFQALRKKTSAPKLGPQRPRALPDIAALACYSRALSEESRHYSESNDSSDSSIAYRATRRLSNAREGASSRAGTGDEEISPREAGRGAGDSSNSKALKRAPKIPVANLRNSFLERDAPNRQPVPEGRHRRARSEILLERALISRWIESEVCASQKPGTELSSSVVLSGKTTGRTVLDQGGQNTKHGRTRRSSMSASAGVPRPVPQTQRSEGPAQLLTGVAQRVQADQLDAASLPSPLSSDSLSVLAYGFPSPPTLASTLPKHRSHETLRGASGSGSGSASASASASASGPPTRPSQPPQSSLRTNATAPWSVDRHANLSIPLRERRAHAPPFLTLVATVSRHADLQKLSKSSPMSITSPPPCPPPNTPLPLLPGEEDRQAGTLPVTIAGTGALKEQRQSEHSRRRRTLSLSASRPPTPPLASANANAQGKTNPTSKPRRSRSTSARGHRRGSSTCKSASSTEPAENAEEIVPSPASGPGSASAGQSGPDSRRSSRSSHSHSHPPSSSHPYSHPHPHPYPYSNARRARWRSSTTFYWDASSEDSGPLSACSPTSSTSASTSTSGWPYSTSAPRSSTDWKDSRFGFGFESYLDLQPDTPPTPARVLFMSEIDQSEPRSGGERMPEDAQQTYKPKLQSGRRSPRALSVLAQALELDRHVEAKPDFTSGGEHKQRAHDTNALDEALYQAPGVPSHTEAEMGRVIYGLAL